MTKRDLTQTELDQLFEAQRTALPRVSEAFLGRIAADAVDAADALSRKQSTPPKGRFSSVTERMASWMTGLGAPGGAVLAGCLGLWIGAANPQFMPDPALLWQAAPDDSSLSQLDAWYSAQDFESVEWDDG